MTDYDSPGRPKKYRKQLAVRIDPEVIEACDAAADEAGVSRSDLVELVLLASKRVRVHVRGDA